MLHERTEKGNTASDLVFVLENIPQELNPLRQWVLYKLGPVKANRKRDKFPINPRTGRLAAVDNPETWGTLDEVIIAYIRGEFDGPGFVFTKDDPFIGIDFDGCRDPQTGHIQPWALDIIRRVNSYTEASPSGTGVHILTKGKLLAGGGKEGQVEMYETGRFFTMTGEHIAGTPPTCEERQEEITDLYRTTFPHKTTGNGFSNGKSTHANMSEAERRETFAELREALPFIPASEHETWLQVGMGLHFVDSGEASFDVWVEWSKTCPEKFDYANCLKRWRSFHNDGGITHKTIFALAIKHGWRAESRTGLPEIVVNNRPLRVVSDESLKALDEKNAPPSLYVRSGRLVRRLYDEHKRPVLDTLTEPALCGFLTRSAEFLKRTTSEKDGTVKDVHVPPPLPLVRDVYSLGSWPFPALIGITECPVLRPDGTVCSVAGYDAATRLLYDPAPGLIVPPLPDSPNEADARKAAQYILTELFSDFPFCDGADLANMVGCLLTPIVRPAINGNVPLCLIDKPAPGSGATMLSDEVSIVATGEHAAKLLAPEGRGAEEEWRKKMTALLADGSPVAVIDNVENVLGSSALSAMLTSSRWKDRILGKTETITLPVRVCLIATANNISVRGDLARRCYRVRIDAQEERPWTRTEFRHPDLLNWTRTHRGEILACLLTMARAWFVAKQPKADVPKLGMFEEWTRMVGGILAASGVPGFLTNLDELYELVDDEGPAWAAFLKALHVYFQDAWFTTAKIANAIGSEMYGAIPDSIGWDESKAASSRKRLGWAFQKRADRVYSGFRLERNKEKDTVQNTAQWRVARVVQKKTR